MTLHIFGTYFRVELHIFGIFVISLHTEDSGERFVVKVDLLISNNKIIH